jgi:hypothetical protein
VVGRADDVELHMSGGLFRRSLRVRLELRDEMQWTCSVCRATTSNERETCPDQYCACDMLPNHILAVVRGMTSRCVLERTRDDQLRVRLDERTSASSGPLPFRPDLSYALEHTPQGRALIGLPESKEPPSHRSRVPLGWAHD